MRRRSALLVLPIALLLAACERTEVNGIGSYTGDEAHPPQLDLVSSGGCSIGEWGFVSSSGRIVNNTDDVASYEVVVAFGDGDERLGQGATWIRDLDAGATARFEATRHLGDAAGRVDTCDVITINRWSATTVTPDATTTP